MLLAWTKSLAMIMLIATMTPLHTGPEPLSIFYIWTIYINDIFSFLSVTVTEVNGVTEPSVAKRLKGTPERIELENYRLSMMREELQEVTEETLAEHNLSSVLDKATDIEEGSRYPSHLYHVVLF